MAGSEPAEVPELLELGRIGRAHGLKGEVTLILSTNHDDERIYAGATLFVDGVERTIEHARQHQGRWLVRFDGVTDRTGAEALTGRWLTGPKLDIQLDPDEMWVHDLIGCTVQTPDGVGHGTVTAVEANPAHDLLVLDNGTLVPMPFVIELRDGVVHVDVPDGLL